MYHVTLHIDSTSPNLHACVARYIVTSIHILLYPVLGSLLLKSNSLHITLYFVESLCITVTYYLEIKVTSIRYYF